MIRHTPGPWIIRKGDEWTRDVVTDHGELPDGSRNYWNVASVSIRREECADNLLLIAAAPELLSWLVWSLNNLSSEAKQSGQYDMARAALAKATGEQA